MLQLPLESILGERMSAEERKADAEVDVAILFISFVITAIILLVGLL
jgi:hypothetical protein